MQQSKELLNIMDMKTGLALYTRAAVYCTNFFNCLNESHGAYQKLTRHTDIF